MIPKKLNYDLNHIYDLEFTPPNIGIGASQAAVESSLIMFDKSLALASDLKRLPILRGLAVMLRPTAALAAAIVAAGVTTIGAYLEIFRDDDLNNKIYSSSILLYHDSVNHVYYVAKDESGWDYEGGLLLNDRIWYRITVETNSNCTGVLNTPIRGDMHFEIDWAEVSQQEFEQFILESVYAKD